MPAIRVFYDVQELKPVPLWLKASFAAGELDWKQPSLHLLLSAPFLPLEDEGLEEEDLGIRIEMEELTRHPVKIDRIGVHLAAVKARCRHFGIDPEEIRHFMLQMGDIEEVLQMESRENSKRPRIHSGSLLCPSISKGGCL